MPTRTRSTLPSAPSPLIRLCRRLRRWIAAAHRFPSALPFVCYRNSRPPFPSTPMLQRLKTYADGNLILFRTPREHAAAIRQRQR